VRRFVEVNRASTTAEFQQTGTIMPNIRTANKNHKRTIAAQIARNKAAEKALAQGVKPVPAAV
jgi:hypothetical protein